MLRGFFFWLQSLWFWDLSKQGPLSKKKKKRMSKKIKIKKGMLKSPRPLWASKSPNISLEVSFYCPLVAVWIMQSRLVGSVQKWFSVSLLTLEVKATFELGNSGRKGFLFVVSFVCLCGARAVQNVEITYRSISTGNFGMGKRWRLNPRIFEGVFHLRAAVKGHKKSWRPNDFGF